MKIIILGAAMPFGPDTLRHKSIGGSETAQLMAGKALAKQGHEVIQITALPPPGEPDHIANGTRAADGVRYVDIQFWQNMVCGVPHDLLIISRNLQFANVPHQAKHAVFWAHDLATYNFMVPALGNFGWNVDEIWAVSEWHADHIATVSGFPRARIFATRNGIVDVTDPTLFDQPEWDDFAIREDKTLIYAARPERGLEALLREGGIMERLPEYRLQVAMYAHFPEHMKPLYDWCTSRIAALPNVEYLGSLNQQQMRRAISAAAAYVYPTIFEETSCILMRECIEQRTPIFFTEAGALPETIGNCGYSLNAFLLAGEYAQPNVTGNKVPDWNTDAFCQKFADMVRYGLTKQDNEGFTVSDVIQDNQRSRDDLYWDDVVREWTERVGRFHSSSVFSRARSLVEDGDAIAALQYLDLEAGGDRWGWQEQQYHDYLKLVYHFVDYDDAQMGAYYEEATKHWSAKYPGQHQGDPVGDHMWGMERHRFVRDHIASLNLPAGSVVFEYGIAEGNLILNLCRAFPQYLFIGADFDELALEKAREYATKHGIKNFDCFNILGDNAVPAQRQFDVVVCCEVLEHVRHPEKHLDKIEQYAKVGGEIILSTPFGGFEAMQWSHFGHDYFRQHIWEFSETDFNEMLGHKEGLHNVQVSAMPGANDGRLKGHYCTFYKSDDQPARKIDINRKIAAHHPRETVTACIITMNAGTTLPRLLDSLWNQVDAVQFAVGPSDDNTMDVIAQFAGRYPWLPVRVLNVPAIKPGEFGFDDARNVSISEISTDWYLWIDSDEYLAGNIRRYLRSSAIDSYGISQHHFTVEPRGAPAQLDRPARLCRRHLKFYGKVHEHAEIEMNKGPGFSIVLPDVDIGHIGYVNETTRRLRFERNFPFLVWDRQVNPTRHLGYYLWFRDIIHRMRYEQQRGNQGGAYQLALEAVAYYKDSYQDIIKFGMGAPVALGYYSEAMRFLGRGREVKMVIALDGAPVQLEGVVDHEDQITDLVANMLKPELEKVRSKYWR